MIIRSQDKSSIVNFNGVDTIKAVLNKRRNEIKEHYETNIVYFGCAKDGILGTYSTEEKATKVLDMIQEAYCGMRSVDCTTRGMLDTFAKREDVSCLLDLHIDKYFFQMPQDSEV